MVGDPTEGEVHDGTLVRFKNRDQSGEVANRHPRTIPRAIARGEPTGYGVGGAIGDVHGQACGDLGRLALGHGHEDRATAADRRLYRNSVSDRSCGFRRIGASTPMVRRLSVLRGFWRP
jgi:hypothetical protein